jgi:RNA polymerase sigma-70 factor (ECF subfamily)
MNSEHDTFNPRTRHGCEIGGRMISQEERVEVGVELAPDTFTLQPSTETGRESKAMHNSKRDRIFGEWLAGHKGILFKVVHAYAFEHADRQDLFQEVAVQVWRSVDAFRSESSVPTWMYRVALNTAIAWSRKEGRHQRGKQQFEGMEGLLTNSPSEGRDPRVEWLYHQIAQLKDVDRSVALLLLDGFSYKEIAAVVGITESNVGVKINRIKSALAGKRMEETES